MLNIKSDDVHDEPLIITFKFNIYINQSIFICKATIHNKINLMALPSLYNMQASIRYSEMLLLFMWLTFNVPK